MNDDDGITSELPIDVVPKTTRYYIIYIEGRVRIITIILISIVISSIE